MQSHYSRIGKTYRAALRSIKGFKKDASGPAALANTAWLFASSCLWNSTPFSTKEIDAAKEKIKEYLSQSKDSRKAFLAFCQRIVLAQVLFAGYMDRLPLPSVWLDRRNKSGFAITKSGYEQIKTVRESLPQYFRELRALAEAVLEFSEEPTGKNYHYWKGYFSDRQVPGALEAFQVFAANFLFTI
ncbi:hypothetical protein [Puia dinghuensis]|uniref:Uncharacterized protein n=1 Tax=Puia dinghuensis TaxID=1792502 RepID=A0A8J2XS89_9BACT|nr:hypothetical protein [Puia dinghuensis]GGA90037.1 hypothetical protein GCM10011511_11600 [Puia dinghuensis]